MHSNFYKEAETILESLASTIGLPHLEFDDEDDTCTLLLDKKIQISITLNEPSNELILHHELGILPESNRYEIVEQLLEANLFWAGTRGATISMERSSGMIMIARAINLSSYHGKPLTGELLATAITDLVDIATHWSQLLHHGTLSSSHNKSIRSMNPILLHQMP